MNIICFISHICRNNESIFSAYRGLSVISRFTFFPFYFHRACIIVSDILFYCFSIFPCYLLQILKKIFYFIFICFIPFFLFIPVFFFFIFLFAFCHCFLYFFFQLFFSFFKIFNCTAEFLRGI